MVKQKQGRDWSSQQLIVVPTPTLLGSVQSGPSSWLTGRPAAACRNQAIFICSPVKHEAPSERQQLMSSLAIEDRKRWSWTAKSRKQADERRLAHTVSGSCYCFVVFVDAAGSTAIQFARLEPEFGAASRLETKVHLD